MYDCEYVRQYEIHALSGRRGGHLAFEANVEGRKSGKALKVVAFPQGGGQVPSIRVAGRWLERFGFALDDEVVLIASPGRIIITRR